MVQARRGRGEGTVKELANGRWRARFSFFDGSGERKRPSAYFDTKRAAQLWLAEQRLRHGRGETVESSTLTTSAWLDDWLAGKKGEVAPLTYDQYERHVRIHLKPRLGRGRLTKLQPLQVRELYTQMDTDGVSAIMRKKIGVTLSMALEDAVKMRLVPNNPAKHVKKPKVERPDIKPMDEEQLHRFLEHAGTDRLYALYLTAVDSGMRQGELFGLCWPDLDWDSGTVFVRHSLEERNGIHRLKEPKNNSSRRRIKLTGTTLTVLHGHKELTIREGSYQADGPIFPARRGGWLRKAKVANKSFALVIAAAGLTGVRFHDLRHTCASLLLHKGVSIKVVSSRLGHSAVSTTLNIYAHVLPQGEEKAVEVLEGMLTAK